MNKKNMKDIETRLEKYIKAYEKNEEKYKRKITKIIDEGHTKERELSAQISYLENQLNTALE